MWESVLRDKGRKMTHGERISFICHGLHESQSLGSGWANIVHPTVLKATDGRTLIGGHQPSSALVESKLHGNLYESVWTHFLLFDILFSIGFECEDIHVEIIH